jgi:hypothetical protein
MMLDTHAYVREGTCRTAHRYKLPVYIHLACLDLRRPQPQVLVRGTTRPTSEHSDGAAPCRALSLGVRQPQNPNGLL